MGTTWLLLLLLVIGLLFALPFILWARFSRLERRVQELQDRLSRLESPHTAAPSASSWVSDPEAVRRAPLAPIAPVAEPHAPFAAAVASARVSAPAPAPPPVPPPALAPARTDARELEDKIGGVWMQNVGAVVLLLGIFLFILWGYSTGRIGAGVLVATGVGLGLVAVWRGHFLAQSLPRFGHAFIGVGFGAVYLALYLGHYTLNVLSPFWALVLLALTSVATFGAGLRYRVQAIAAFGVLGAFIPQLFAAWFELRGFTLSPLALLGYLAVVDGLVFALAARAGWSGLDLAALLLSAVTWIAANPRPEPTWAPVIGLGVLFTGLGLAPLPALTKAEGEVRAVDLAVIAGAPAALMITTWPWLANAPRPAAALFLFAAMIPQMLAAWWVDVRRPERDLWRPLTGAAIVFLTLGIQRVVDERFLAATWGVEGVLLVLLGLAPRNGWLRLCGHGITAMAFAVAIADPTTWGQEDLPARILGASSVREAIVIASLAFGAWALARGRANLERIERWTPEAWTFAANVLLMFWLSLRCDELTGTIHRALTHEPQPYPEAGSWHRWPGLFVACLGAAWCAQASVLVWRGTRAGGGFLRASGYVVAAIAIVITMVSHGMGSHWRPGDWPILYPEGLVVLGSMLLLLVLVLRLARHRGLLGVLERKAPEAFAVGLIAISLFWNAREAGHLALRISGASASGPGSHTLSAALTSAAWLVEAVLLLGLGWMRATPLLRWGGLVILGLTLAKFMLYDLATADVFWRFLTAIAAGAAMLAVSYAYQKRVRARRAE